MRPTSQVHARAHPADQESVVARQAPRRNRRINELPLTQDMISQLAVKAAVRGVPICDLIGDLIMEMLRRASAERG